MERPLILQWKVFIVLVGVVVVGVTLGSVLGPATRNRASVAMSCDEFRNSQGRWVHVGPFPDVPVEIRRPQGSPPDPIKPGPCPVNMR